MIETLNRSRQLKWIAVGVVLTIAAGWGLFLFLGATHGVAVRRARITAAKVSLLNVQAWLRTNDLDTNFLATFQVEPWTNAYDVSGRAYRAALRTRAGFGRQGCLVLTDDGSYLFVYEDPSQEPKLVDESYSPPALPTYAY